MLLELSDENRHCSHGKQQGGEALPNLDHSFEGYDCTDIFQWELVVQMYTCGATSLNDTNKVGTKLWMLLIKLQTAHGKGNFELFNEQ
eukprot:10757095-Ditylum_brightwellii.AAC.1